MASVNSYSWQELFREGNYSACTRALKRQQENLLLEKNANDSDHYAQSFSIENNIFVCEQLSQQWDLGSHETIARKWAQSYCEVIDVHRRLRCQHACSRLPLDLILTVTCNAMWWGIMKVDPSDQQSCQKDVINAAVYSLSTVRKSFGGRNPEGRLYETIETNFIDAVSEAISCLPKLTPKQFQLTLEIICLGILSCVDSYKNIQDKVSEFQKMIDGLVDILPQVKVHFSCGNTRVSSNCGNLLKFGGTEVASVFSQTCFLTISETLLNIVAMFCFRCNPGKLIENSSKSLSYLNLIDKNSLVFPFMYHYLHAFANFNLGNLDASLYHLQHAAVSSPNFFMQARSKILKGQILLSQEKASAALETLQSVQYKRKEVQLPKCAFLIASAYQKLGKIKEQIDILNLLLNCLTAEHAVKPKLPSPLAGLQHRLLLSVHSQPEISAEHVLESIAMAHFSMQQPKEAADKLFELLHLKSLVMDDELGFADSMSMWKLSELFHDAICALLEAYCLDDAEELCEAALQFHSSRFDLVEHDKCDFSTLGEDVISLILLGEVKDLQQSSDVSEILNRCVRLLQGLVEKISKSKKSHTETLSKANSFLARVFLHKALLNAKKKFDDDATACFQRALSFNEGDTEVILYFARFLLDRNQHEESLALWSMFKDANQSLERPQSIALNHILGDKMTRDEREETMCRLGSLETM